MTKSKNNPEPSSTTASARPPYTLRPEGIFKLDNSSNVQLTNFTVESVRSIIEDDGDNQQTAYEIAAKLGDQTGSGKVSAAEFQKMQWPQSILGFRATVFPHKEAEARTAIQLLAPQLQSRKIYTHTGWRKMNGEWIFLHAGGAIGRSVGGTAEEIKATLPHNLQRFSLPEPGSGDELRRAIRYSLGLLDVAEPTISFPIFGAIFRAPLGDVDFVIHANGLTGSLKTAVVTVAQQFFGPTFDDQHLPGYWNSTGNFLQKNLHAAKDVLAVVDDFVPKGTKAQIDAAHKQFDEVVRAVTDGAGRGRLRANGDQVAPPRPRGLIISTGEVTPRGESGLARGVNLTVRPGSIDRNKLTICQENANSGIYAVVMAGFISWLAPRFDQIRATLRSRILDLRAKFAREGQHLRTAENIANLALGVESFLQFGLDVGAITAAEIEEIWNKSVMALCDVAADQGYYQSDEDPAREALQLLASADRDGRLDFGHPKSVDDALSRKEISAFDPSKLWIGWREDEDSEWLCDPDALYRALTKLHQEQNRTVPWDKGILFRRFVDRGYVPKPDEAKRYTVRRLIGKERKRVIVLTAEAFAKADEAAPESACSAIRWLGAGTVPQLSQEVGTR